MELSFICGNSADASYLAQELELALRKGGVPTKALSLKQASNENMDIGSILSIDIATATEILSPVGSIASLVTCIYEVATKYHSGVVVNRDNIPASELSFKRIEKAVARSNKPKPKPKSR